MRRAKQKTIVVTAAALVAGVLSIASPAQAAVTATAGIPITIENSGKCVNVAGASTANGAKVVQYTCVASALNDKWQVVGTSVQDVYQIKNIASGKCLTVLGASTTNNASLIQWACTTGGNETWYIESQSARPTMRLISAGSGLCLDVPGRSVVNNVNLVQYTCQAGDGTSNERVTMPPTTSAAVVHRPFTIKQPVAVVQGGKPAGGGTAPVSYNWIGADNEWYTVTDFNPDKVDPDPNAPAPSGLVTSGYGYTGRPVAAVLADQRVHVIAHDAAAGDVQYSDETDAGTGNFGDIYDLGGAMDAQPTIGASGRPAQLAIYAVIGGALWYDPEGTGNLYAPIGGWRTLGGTSLTGVPASVSTGSGARVFARNTAGQIQTAALSGTTLGDWSSLGGTGLGDPNVLSLPGNLALVSAQAADGSIVYKEQKADGTWPADWTTITGVAAAGNPSAVIGSADGRIDIAIRGTDSLVYVAQETAAGSGQFGGWTEISTPATDPDTIAASDPTAFAYTVPSGKSFGVIFQTTDPAVDGAYGIYLPPGWAPTVPTTAVARTAQSRSGIRYEAIAKPKKMERATAKKTAFAH